jgi:anti-anti-sigma regulatory factor
MDAHERIGTRPNENVMLKINFSETPAEEKWILHGRLTDPWVHELKRCWRKNHRTNVRRACIVDLSEVTCIDKSGEQLLCMLARNGVEFIASGTYTKHVLNEITNRLRLNNSTSKPRDEKVRGLHKRGKNTTAARGKKK